jgi:hypothetical protein
MQTPDLSHARWDQPEDADHPVLLMIVAMVAIAMFSLVWIYG